MSIKAGIVVVTEFCSPDSAKFNQYISYIDRDEAVSRENMEQYSLFGNYLDYVGDSMKTETGLFTKEADNLSLAQKQQLKEVFSAAQTAGSLMWQPVISFDNRWLKEQGFYDDDIGLTQERRFIAAARAGIDAMLRNENLENAMWAADIHHNTDNIHIHVATVEPDPQRSRRAYVQYEKERENGKWKYKRELNAATGRYEKIPLKDEYGQIIFAEEFKGKFEQKSLQLCKSMIVNELAKTKDATIEITELIREKLINQKEISGLYNDLDFRQSFLELADKMPNHVSRRLWTYNSSIMKPLRKDIDSLTDKYIEKYHKDDFAALKRQLEAKAGEYKRGYGDSGRNYAENKLQELYARLGNQILREIRRIDERMETKENTEPSSETELRLEEPADEIIADIEEGYYEWSDQYKAARKLIYNDANYDEGIALLREEAKKGNALALYELGDSYRLGRGTKANLETANIYYAKAMEIFSEQYMSQPKEKQREYLAYRIGKMYNFGLGVAEDKDAAGRWFEKAPGNQYAAYSLAGLYERGEGREKDMQTAIELYKRATSMPYAAYKLGRIFEQGKGVTVDNETAQMYYSMAYAAFIKSENEADDNLLYRLGVMEERGQGTISDIQAAQSHLKKASELGNLNAQYALAKIYLKYTDNVSAAIKLLQNVAEKGNNDMAMYSLGKIYSDTKARFYDIDTAIRWFEKSAARDNTYALFQLGKIYTSPEKSKNYGQKGIECFKEAAAKGDPYSKLKLGLIYYRGELVSKDISKALSYLDAASAEGVTFAGDIARSIRERGRKNVRAGRVRLIDNNELRMALFYLRQTLRANTEHFMNMNKYEEMKAAIEAEEETQHF